MQFNKTEQAPPEKKKTDQIYLAYVLLYLIAQRF